MRFVLSFCMCVLACTRAQQSSTSDGRSVIEARAREVLSALRARDGARLASHVHPVKGVRLSPYQYVHPDSDVVLQRVEVQRAWLDTRSRLWGYSDGSGAPLRYPFETYYRRFVWDHDYTAAERVAYDAPPLQHANTPNNIAEVYPASVHVEYHFPGFDAKYGGMDWASLFLVFERYQKQWYLVGVVHAGWTI